MKVTGPIIHRIDFVLQMKSTGIFTQTTGESSSVIRQRVNKARDIQRERYGMSSYAPAIITCKLLMCGTLDEG